MRSFVLAYTLCVCFAAGQVVFLQAGITYVNDKYCPNVTYDTPKSDLSLENLASTGANFVSIVVTQYQDTVNSTTIYPIFTPTRDGSDYYIYLTATPSALVHAIDKAHSLGLKVMLKPQIDLTFDNAHWRGDIGMYFNESQWDAWFQSYGSMLLQYAELAQNSSVEQLSLSCELITASTQSAQWRALIAKVRMVFNGTLTDSANWGYANETGPNHGEVFSKTWWDAVDIIGVDAYWPLTPMTPNPTLNELIKAWEPIVEMLQNVSATYDRPLMFTEVGYCSGECSRNKSAPVNLYNQMLHYTALFEAFTGPAQDGWFLGIFWWAWNTDPAYGGASDNCISPQFKPAEDVLRMYYGAKGPPSVMPPYEPVCICTV